jgi:hypothetical protein
MEALGTQNRQNRIKSVTASYPLFTPMEENATVGCRKFYNAKLPNLYSSPDMSMKNQGRCLCFATCFLLGSFFDPEDGIDMILRNAG